MVKMKVALFKCLKTFPYSGVELKLHTHSNAAVLDKPNAYFINRKIQGYS